MTITITIPKATTIVRRGWKFGLLALVALAVVLTWGTHGTRQVRGVGGPPPPPSVAILKLDSVTLGFLPGSCWDVDDPANVPPPLFTVCDNNFAPATALDIDPKVGIIVVPAPPGVYHVMETVAPPGYNADPSKLVCFVDGFSPGCSGMPVVFFNTPKAQININKIAQYVPPQSCYRVFDALNLPPELFSVCDNDFQGPPDTSAVCLPAGVCTDVDPAVGSIRVNVVPDDYHVVESKPPPNHTMDPAKYLCDASVSPKCEVTVIDTPLTRPWHPWDIMNADTGMVGADGLVRIDDIVAVVQNYFNDKPLP